MLVGRCYVCTIFGVVVGCVNFSLIDLMYSSDRSSQEPRSLRLSGVHCINARYVSSRLWEEIDIEFLIHFKQTLVTQWKFQANWRAIDNLHASGTRSKSVWLAFTVSTSCSGLRVSRLFLGKVVCDDEDVDKGEYSCETELWTTSIL